MALALVEEVAGLLEIGVMMGDPVSKLWGIWAQRQGQHEPECAAIAAELVGTYGAISVRAMFRVVWRHDLCNLVKKHIGEFKPGWITTLEQISGIKFKCLTSARVPASAELRRCTKPGTSSSFPTACTNPGFKRPRFSEDESLGQQLAREGRLEHFFIPLALLREAASDTIDLALALTLTLTLTHRPSRRLAAASPPPRRRLAAASPPPHPNSYH
jgi:hypothetical protein